VPHYRAGNALIVELVPFARDRRVRALDVGAGTGVLSALLLKEFARMTVVALDASPAMLAACAANLAAQRDRIELREGAFPDADIGAGYDLVVSSLALHHLAHAQKRRGFRVLFEALRPGGVLLVRDLVAAATPALDRQYEALWRRAVADHGHDDMSWFDAHLAEDNPAKVEDQLAWLAEAGFADAGCHWRYLNFALFGGRRPED
jgi:tRNA (cmo5U34)-methyltransferase